MHLCLQCTTIVHDSREGQSQSDCHEEIRNVYRYQEDSNYNEVARYRHFDCVFCQGGLSYHDYDDWYHGYAYDYAGTSGAWILLSVKFLFFSSFFLKKIGGFMMRDVEMKEVYDYDCVGFLLSRSSV